MQPDTEARPLAANLADAVTDLGRLAMAFGRIDRTACYHEGAQMRESDSDHTVMLCWVAPALASRLCPSQLDTGLIAKYALVHDMCEVYAGDTPTLRIDGAGRAAKAERENWAVGRLVAEFSRSLPWGGYPVTSYERQADPEARFTRAVDKILPKIVHQVDRCHGLIEEGITPAELRSIVDHQVAEVATYAGEFTALMDLYREMADRAVALLEEVTGA
jgi:putative hydrolases of HD superfamily